MYYASKRASAKDFAIGASLAAIVLVALVMIVSIGSELIAALP